MVAVKAANADRFINRLDPAIRAVLVYGMDPGRIAELASRAAVALSHRTDPAGEIVRIDDADLEDNPDRLIIELETVSMFAEAKVIRTTTGRRVNANLLKPVLEGAPPPTALVIEAGNLKPSDALRKAAEKSGWIGAIACYADSERDLGDLIDEMVAAAGKSIAPSARDLLCARLGADRALSRGEIEKLTLYAAQKDQISDGDVDAIVGDATAATVDRIAIATADGKTADALADMARILTAGQSEQTILLAVQRHFLVLHRVRSFLDSGKRLDDVLRQMRPPLHFSLRDAVTRQTRAWPQVRLNHAISRIQATITTGRSGGPIPTVATCDRLIMELCRLARS